MTPGAQSDLWSFAVKVYGQPGVGERCLALQDHHQLDANVLLFCCWLGRDGHVAAAVDWPSVVVETSRWQTLVVARLRRLRQRLKAASACSEPALRLRSELLDCELRAETVELAALPAWVASPAGAGPELDAAHAAAHYLSAYCRALDLIIEGDLEQALAQLLARIYALSPAQACALVKSVADRAS